MWKLSTILLVIAFMPSGAVGMNQCMKDLSKLIKLQYASNLTSLQMLSYTGINIFTDDDPDHPLVNDAGNYIACSSIKVAQHCLIVHSPVQIRGICVPISCNEDSLPDAMVKVGRIFKIPPIFNITREMMHCGNHQHNLSPGGTVMILISILLVILVLAATSFDILNSKRVQRMLTRHNELTHPLNDEDHSRGSVQTQKVDRDKSPTDFSDEDENLSFLERCLVAFSIRRNFATLMHRPPSRKYKALDGIRSFSLIGIIVAHSANFTLMVGFTNPNDIYPPHGVSGKYFFILFIMVWGFAVDSFFFLSGFLSTLVVVRKLDKGMNILKLSIMGILHRFLRLTPTFGFVIGVFTTMGNSWGQGPFWWQMELLTKKCHEYWWTNLLYINNFHPSVYDQQCLPWTWYLANDFQFFVFGVIFMCVTNKIRRCSELLLTVFIIVSVCVTVWICIHWNVAALNLTDGGLMQNKIYDKPYNRVPAYIVGMISVLIFMRIERNAKQQGLRRGKLRRAMKFKKWFVAPILMVSAIGVLIAIASFLYWDATTPEGVNNWNQTQNVLWLAFTRPAWAMAIGVMVLLCITGQGGVVNSVLSWWFWVPIAQLTYSAYLIHPIIIRIVYFNRADLFVYNDSILLMNGVAFVGLAYMGAIVLFCTIEMPFGTLEGLVIGGGKKRRKQVSTCRPKAEG